MMKHLKAKTVLFSLILLVSTATVTNGCVGDAYSEVFLNTNQIDFDVILKSDVEKDEFDVSYLVVQNEHAAVKAGYYVEITLSKFWRQFKILNFQFRIIGNIGTDIEVKFITGNGSTVYQTQKVQSGDVILDNSFLQSVNSIERIIISVWNSTFKIGGMLLHACENEYLHSLNVNSDTNNVRTRVKRQKGRKDRMKVPKGGRWTFPKPASISMEHDCCVKQLQEESTTLRTTRTAVVPQGFTIKVIKLSFIIDSGLWNKQGLDKISKLLADLIKMTAPGTGAAVPPSLKLGVLTFSKISTKWFGGISPKRISTLAVKKILQKIRPAKFNKREVDFVAGLKTLLDDIACSKQGELNIVLFTTSFSHQGCHSDLIDTIAYLSRKALIYAIGVGPSVNEDELKLFKSTSSDFEQVSDIKKISAFKNIVSNWLSSVQREGLRSVGLFRCEKPKLVTHRPCFFAPKRQLPDIVTKDKRKLSIWRETEDLFEESIKTCEFSEEFEERLRNEAGGSASFPGSQMNKFLRAYNLFSQQVLEGRFKLQSRNKKDLQVWMGEKSGLARQFAKMKSELGKLKTAVINMAGVRKKSCLTKAFQNSPLSKRINQLNGKILKIRKL